MHHTLNNEDELEKIEQAHNRFFSELMKTNPDKSEAPSPTGFIEMQPVESSQIHSIGYDPESRTMAVAFVRNSPAPGRGSQKGRVAGPVYHYQGVPPEEHKALMAAPSKYYHFHSRKATAFAKFTKVSE